MDMFGENLRKLILAGIGAASVSKDKAEKVLEELIKRGELTVEQGKVLNEELKHSVKQAVKENVTVVTQATPEDILASVDSMNEDELSRLKARIDAAEKARNQASAEAEQPKASEAVECNAAQNPAAEKNDGKDEC